VTLFALWLALSQDASVFDLVVSSWAVLGACFGPLLIVLALGQRPTQALCVLMMVTGLAGVYLWLQVDYLSAYYEGTLAICAGFVVFALGKLMGFAPAADRKERETTNVGPHPLAGDLPVRGEIPKQT
jgi:sodium/proline symporter